MPGLEAVLERGGQTLIVSLFDSTAHSVAICVSVLHVSLSTVLQNAHGCSEAGGGISSASRQICVPALLAQSVTVCIYRCIDLLSTGWLRWNMNVVECKVWLV